MHKAVPYLERCYRTISGTALIWPFINLEPSKEKLELFLDNNALTKSGWMSELPQHLLRDCVVNPWMAIQEQWFSNPCFREDPETRINAWNEKLAQHGVRFRAGYGSDQVQLLIKNEKALRRQFSSVVPFVAIMHSILSQKMQVDESLARLAEIGRADIPRFTGLIALTALGVALKKQQSIRLEGDPKPAYSYLSSFHDFHSGGKDESDYMSVSYFRNRAGDLNMWLALPMLRQVGYAIGNRTALVTGDKALHRVILRAIPPVMTSSGVTTFGVAANELDRETYERVALVLQSLQPRESSTLDEQLARMKTLFDLAKAWTSDQRERDALDEVFSEWWRPGHGMEIAPL